jgi:L-ascorbate metabolism protein UlaG (beta-lactamase superfamily)
MKLDPAPWLTLEPTRAIHGHIERSVYSGANFSDCGYIVGIGGKRFFHPGDSVLLHEHLEISNVDVLFVSPTEHNTHVDGSISLINSINPGRVFAQHFGTYPVTESNAYWTTGYEEPLRLALSSKHRSRYVIPVPGSVYAV